MASPSSAEARMQANLRLLQRTCSPAISGIVQGATHVVLYEFLDNAWQKSAYEGSLFLVASTTPVNSSNTSNKTYLLVILNRQSTENFLLDVTADFQLQHQEPYLIFRQAAAAATTSNNTTTDAKTVKGIWFHNAHERIAMAHALQGVLQEMQQAPPPVVAAVDPAAAVSALLSTASLASTTTTTVQPQPQSPATPVPLTTTTAAAVATTTVTPDPNTVLDKKALQLALLSLVQDDRFLDLLHAQYQRVVKARAARPPAP